MKDIKKRFDELEGLRGVAAVMVALYHFFLAFYIIAFMGIGANKVQHTFFEDNLYGNPIMGVFSGTFMVAIFFVLSGFVLSIGFFQSGKSNIIKKLAAKRYIRLMVPALVSIMIAFILLSIGIAGLKNEVAAISGSQWLSNSWATTPDFIKAFQSGVFGIFTKPSSPYNNVLWTMVYEFAGSFLVFGSLLLFGKLKYRWVFYVFLIFATFNTWFLGFVLGMVLADLYAKGRIQTKKHSWFLVIPLMALVLFLAAYPHEKVDGTVYQYTSMLSININWLILHLTLAAFGAVTLILLVKQLSTLFKARLFSALGKYTFALYLTHLLVIYTFSMAVFLLLNKTFGLGYNWSALLTLVASVPVVTLVAFLFEKYVDAPSIRLSTNVANILLGYSEPPRVWQKAKLAYRRTLKRLLKRTRRQPDLIIDELEITE